MRRINFQIWLNLKSIECYGTVWCKTGKCAEMPLLILLMWIFAIHAKNMQKHQLQLFVMYAGMGRQSCKVFEEANWWRGSLYCSVSHQLLEPCTGSCSWECKAFRWDRVREGSSQEVCEEGWGVWLYAGCCTWTPPWTYSSKKCPTR